MTDRILETVSVRDYFEEAVENALREHRICPQEATAAYLVNLLCEFISRSVEELERPLALSMAESQLALPENRIPKLKRVGDDALYLSGYLRRSLRRRRLDIGYYQRLGGSAYERLSHLMVRPEGRTQLADVYVELSTEFPQFTDVLADVQLQSEGGQDVGQLYETWFATQSKRIERQLREAGVQDLSLDEADDGDSGNWSN